MSLHYNELIFKGKSTADFPFEIFVIENDGINKGKRKDKIFTSDDMSGGIVRTSTAYELVEKSYKLLIHDVKLNQINELLVWLEGSGKLIASDNPGRYYEVLTVSAVRARLGEVDEYEIDVVFTCNPFSYSIASDIKTYIGNGVINNETNVIMYPKITLYGNSTSGTSLTISNQVVRLNVYDKNGNLLNSVMLGAFFEIKPGVSGIVLGNGITKLEIECRWGAFI